MVGSINFRKNIIFFYSFILILFLVIIFTIFNNMIALKLDTNIIDIEQYNDYFQGSVFLFLFSILLVVIISQKLFTTIEKNKALKLESRKQLEIINSLYLKLQKYHSVKNISNISLEFLGDIFKANSGKLYITDYKNDQLLLSGTYNTIIKYTQQTLEVYRGTIGEAVAFQKIKEIKNSTSHKIMIPLITDSVTIGVMVFHLKDSYDDFKITSFHKTLIKIVSDFLAKELKNEQNEKYFKLIDNYVIISSTNKDGIINYTSSAFEKTIGYSKTELLGQSHNIIKSPNIKEKVFKTMWETISDGKAWHNQIENIKKDGSICWMDSHIDPDFDYYGNIIGYTAIRTDITDKKVIEKISITDALTNIYNRRYFDEMFIKQLNLAKRVEKLLAFSIIDIDHFKQYNDSYGHQMGDETLKKVATAIRKSIPRSSDLSFRLGGEEFGMLYFVNSVDEAKKIANKTIKSVEDLKIEHSKNSASPYITISMGLFTYNNEDISAKEIYKQTDELLYKAKQTGRNKIIVKEEI